MKIILLLNNDNYCVLALSYLALELKNHEVEILLSSAVGKKEVGGILAKIKEIENFQVKENFAKITNELNCKIDFVENINCEKSFAKIAEFAPDLIVSIRFGQIIKNQELIKIARFGVVNLHSGILPKYRGIMASFWAILRGENEIGTSLHYIEDEKIDCGGIIKISRRSVNFQASLIENIANLYKQGCADILWFLEKIKNNEKIATIDIKGLQEQYFSMPQEEDLIKCGKIINLF